MITQNTDGSQTIQASDLIEYSLDLQTLIKQGYAVQLSNDEAPILLGYMCIATLKKDEDNALGALNVTINVDSPSVESTQKKPAGRPKAIKGGV